MKQICAWCMQDITEESGPADGKVSHGICLQCLDYFYPGRGKPPTFDLFLERLAVPVLVVDDEVRVVFANEKACALLGKQSEELTGRLGGDAVECAYARLPGGCGKTVHCKSCTIRRAVLDTAATGRMHQAVPAYLDSVTPHGVVQVRLFITTAKSGDFVLLKIAEAADGRELPIGQ